MVVLSNTAAKIRRVLHPILHTCHVPILKSSIPSACALVREGAKSMDSAFIVELYELTVQFHECF